MKYSSKAMWLKGFNNTKIHADNSPGEIEAFYIIKIEVSPNYRRILFTGYIERMIVFNRELQGAYDYYLYIKIMILFRLIMIYTCYENTKCMHLWVNYIFGAQDKF